MSPKKNRQTTWVTLFVAIGSIGYGYAASIIGQVLGQPTFFESFNLAQEGPGLDYTNAIIGAMNGIFFAGATLGCLFIAWTATAFGRLRTIQLASCVCIIGAALMAGSVNIPMYLASRFIMGWGVGMITMMVCGIPLYQAELSPPNSRGFHVGLHGSGLGCSYSQYCAAALFVGVAPISFANIGYLFYVVFVCLDVCTFMFVWKYIPEMKGLSLEEINELFGDPVAVHITHADKQETEEIEARIENFDTKSVGLGEVTPPTHVEDNGEKRA